MGSLDVTETPTALKSRFCCEIRSKKVLSQSTIPVKESDILDHSGHCWCRITMQVVGPDGGYVSPKHCGPDRACYKSHFEGS